MDFFRSLTSGENLELGDLGENGVVYYSGIYEGLGLILYLKCSNIK